MAEENLILYSRSKCPLCEEAKSILECFSIEKGIGYREIDINSKDELLERFALMIPVIEWNGEIIQYGKVKKKELYGIFEK